MPTTMFGGGTPLSCTLCISEYGNCDFGNPSETNYKNDTPNFGAYWVKKYCTMTTVDTFTLYFPYVLLIMPIIMVAMEKGFVKYKLLYFIFYSLRIQFIL